MTRVRNRLAEKMALPGGISRDRAISAANQLVENLRFEYEAAIPSEIDALNAIIAREKTIRVSNQQLNELLASACRVLTLAGTFGHQMLDEAVKKFCDLCVAMRDKEIGTSEALKVHIQTMRMLAPGTPIAADRVASLRLLEELYKIHVHLKIKSLGAVHPACRGGGPSSGSSFGLSFSSTQVLAFAFGRLEPQADGGAAARRLGNTDGRAMHRGDLAHQRQAHAASLPLGGVKGHEDFSRWSAGMPGPLSATAITTWPPASSDPVRAILPGCPSRKASIALRSRLISAWSRSSMSADSFQGFRHDL